jgi:hypothetical protein
VPNFQRWHSADPGAMNFDVNFYDRFARFFAAGLALYFDAVK